MSESPRKYSDGGQSVDGDSEALGSDWELETGDEQLYQTRPRQRHGLFASLRNLLSGTASRSKFTPNVLNSTGDEAADGRNSSKARWQRTAKPKNRLWIKWLFWRIPIIVLCCFGMIHLILSGLSRKSVFWDSRPPYSPGWGKPGNPGEGLADYPTDATRDVLPIPCHSHNDYWRRIPLFEALSWGCIGTEADVWQMKGEEELLVGHSKSSLTKKRTFTSLYIDPLVKLLDSMNPTTDYADVSGHGVFDEDPDQTLVLLVDFKTNGEKLFPLVQQQLEPLRSRNHLSYWDGDTFHSRAITVVGTGNCPFDLVVQNTTYRDIFFDAPIADFYNASTSSTFLQRRGQGSSGTGAFDADSFNSSNSYYASTSFDASIGLPYGELSARQLDLLRGQIKGAHDRGLKARYWETPGWPTSLRNHVWDVLWREGADMLNVDDLEAAAKFDWTIKPGHGIIDA